MKLHVRPGLDLAQMKDDIAWLKSQEKKVLISLGGGESILRWCRQQASPTS